MTLPEKLHEKGPCGECDCDEGLDFSFSFAFQPIIDVDNQDVYAYEALVRGTQGEGAHTILNRVNEHNRYSFDQRCRVKAVKLASRLKLQTRLSINFMPNAVYEPENCIRTTLAAAKTYNFDTSKLIFELTENEALTDADHLVSIISAYREMGFQVALDDFGAGYSRMNVVIASPPNLIKLDMSLLRGIERNNNQQAVVNGILVMSDQLGSRVIAEGVETIEEYRWLRQREVSLFQGYLFARPGFEELPKPFFPKD
jgi:EAL domain-containing protein (putative c-di-GMP-specific phosphodiesterase class I)